MAHVAVELDERARIADPDGTLAGEQATLVAPARDRLLAAGVQRLLPQRFEPAELCLGRLVVGGGYGAERNLAPCVAASRRRSSCATSPCFGRRC
jgi:hypothetical protein